MNEFRHEHYQKLISKDKHIKSLRRKFNRLLKHVERDTFELTILPTTEYNFSRGDNNAVY